MDKTSVNLLYIGSGVMPPHDDEWDLNLLSAASVEAAVLIEARPDLILMDPDTAGDQIRETALAWLGGLRPERFNRRPGLILAVDSDLSGKVRLGLLAAGFDLVVEKPLSIKELRLKSRPLLARVRLLEQQLADQQALSRSFSYLDRFKSELHTVKTELTEEKNSLNTALKQIQKMTDERTRMKQEIAEIKEVLSKNVSGFAQILTTLVQTRVEASRGHGEQVARIAEFLGREMGLDENQLEDLRKAAMLHEVGLLFMSEGFLADKGHGENDGGISAYDRTIMRQYGAKGADLLNHCPGFEKVALIIRALNEWSDGTGYPDGLKRRHIPISSRILAGADELEKLRERPDIQGPAALLAGLEALAGQRLDPVIVGLLGKYVVTCMTAEAFRVKGVGIGQLEPGMTLGAALFTATGTKLFSANTQLTRESIDKIVQYSREYPVDEIVYVKV